ncbi:unnamed protein product [Hermetia illucens]|uniref:Uncharacterized protein n=1 Tax=Hermetia illucens TaxID=343691 RepID=A0A7R8UWN7_HERIL|nr:unnamed protein product [Hermetia illucens]
MQALPTVSRCLTLSRSPSGEQGSVRTSSESALHREFLEGFICKFQSDRADRDFIHYLVITRSPLSGNLKGMGVIEA